MSEINTYEINPNASFREKPLENNLFGEEEDLLLNAK
jgi:hypothetical protein